VRAANRFLTRQNDKFTLLIVNQVKNTDHYNYYGDRRKSGLAKGFIKREAVEVNGTSPTTVKGTSISSMPVISPFIPQATVDSPSAPTKTAKNDNKSTKQTGKSISQ